jgi:MSHA pilin protein MshD
MGGTRQNGASLVELIISIVIITVAVIGVLLVMQHTSLRSADPMVRHQGVAIAEAYLDEILSKAFSEPSATPESGVAEAGETRVDYDDVRDYLSLPDTVVRDQNGNSINNLESYNVSVAIVGNTLGSAGAPAPAMDALRVTVTVTHPSGFNSIISGYRTNY